MIFKGVVFLLLIAESVSRPGPVRSRRSLPAVLIPDNFHHLYVHKDGSITNYTDDESKTIEIGGTPLCKPWSVYVAATVVSTMTLHIESSHFDRLASSRAAAGVFTKAEKLILYPEYAKYANGDCGHSCSGHCRHTCSGDGRKWENLPGLGGTTAAIVENNLICTKWGDPYGHRESILAHEFSHTMFNRLTPDQQHRVGHNYIQAKANHTWQAGSYAMSTVQEYWAESATVYLGVQRYSYSNAGLMNECHPPPDRRFCQDEVEGRANLKAKDPDQYDILIEVFTDNRPEILHHLPICPGEEPDDFDVVPAVYA